MGRPRKPRPALWHPEDDATDIGTVRRARGRLADLLRANPDLANPENRERLAAWLAQENIKPSPVPISIRLDADIMGRLEEVIRENARPGISMTKADAVRMVLAAGFRAMDREE